MREIGESSVLLGIGSTRRGTTEQQKLSAGESVTYWNHPETYLSYEYLYRMFYTLGLSSYAVIFSKLAFGDP